MATRYMINKYSGRGGHYLSILKHEEPGWTTKLISFNPKNGKVYKDEAGNEWRDADEFEGAFYGFDDEYTGISEEEAMALIQEMKENGNTDWDYFKN